MIETSEQPPFLHDLDLMLALLKIGDPGPAELTDCIVHIRNNLGAARVKTRVNEDDLRGRLASALYKLDKAKLVEPGLNETYRTTARGRRALRNHPLGVDGSVLAKYPEFADFIEKLSRRRTPASVGAMEYEQGYEAYTAGRNFTDNPYSDDSTRHLAWENGWFQAFDEHGHIEHE